MTITAAQKEGRWKHRTGKLTDQIASGVCKGQDLSLYGRDAVWSIIFQSRIFLHCALTGCIDLVEADGRYVLQVLQVEQWRRPTWTRPVAARTRSSPSRSTSSSRPATAKARRRASWISSTSPVSELNSEQKYLSMHSIGRTPPPPATNRPLCGATCWFVKKQKIGTS